MKTLALVLRTLALGTPELAVAQTFGETQSGQSAAGANSSRDLSLGDLANQLVFTNIAHQCQMISWEEYSYFEQGVWSWIAIKSGATAADLAVRGAAQKATDIYNSVTAGPGGLSCSDLALDLLDNSATAREAYATRLFDPPVAGLD